MEIYRSQARRFRDALGLSTQPVAVFLLGPDADSGPFEGWETIARHRYCQAVMRARRGQPVILSGDELACPAAAAVFGIRPLPEKLADGTGLMGFGIVSHAETGRRMFADMPRLDPGAVERIALCPADRAPRVPDVMVVEGPPEQLMWIALADLNRAGGERRTTSTAILQATCADSTVIPFLERRLNFSLGCYGCRESTDINPGETVLGFPGALLPDLAQEVERLAAKAMPRSRDKAPYRRLTQGAGEQG